MARVGLRDSLWRLRRRLGWTVHRYDPQTQAVYELGSERVVPAGQAFYDPEVFGRYDLARQRVVPRDPDESLFGPSLDLLTAEAQRLARAVPAPVEHDRYRLVLPLLRPGTGICLDACTASPEEWVRERVTELGYDYVPIDLHGDGTVVRREDLTALGFADDSVACAISLDTLEHILEYERALAELYRVLAPGGVAVFHVPCYFFDRPDSAPIRTAVDPWGHVRYFAARELIEQIAGAGFVLPRVGLQLDYGAALCVAAKPPVSAA